MSILKFTARQWVAIILMELIILLATAFFIYEFAAAYVHRGDYNMALAWFCLVIGIGVFVGGNVFMVWIIRKMRARG